MDDRERMATLENQIKNLALATEANSKAIGDLTDTLTELRITLSSFLSANKAMFKTAFAFSGVITAAVSGIIGLYYWISSIVHNK